MIVPSSSTKVGSFDSGFSFISSKCGLVVATTVRTQVRRSTRPSSCAATMTLRTNGERGDQCSFMTIPVLSRCSHSVLCAVLVETAQNIRHALVRTLAQLIESRVSLGVDADHQRAERFDAQLHETIVRDEIVPRDRLHLLHGIGEERGAAAQEREVDAADLLHGVGAGAVEPALAADHAQAKL